MAYTLQTMKTIICRDMKCVQDNVIPFLPSLCEKVQSESQLRNNGNNDVKQILVYTFILPLGVLYISEASEEWSVDWKLSDGCRKSGLWCTEPI
jgi:hypothetical protein